MCSVSIKRTLGGLLTAATVLLFGGAPSKADLAPGSCTPGSNGSDAVPQASSPGPYVVGELMGYRVLLTNPTLDQFLNPGCTISNAFVNLRLPSGEIIPVLTNIVLAPGQQIICPGAPECLSIGRTALIGAQLFYTNIITMSQVTNVNLTIPQCPPAPGTNAAILAFTLGGAIVFNNSSPGVFGTATYNRCSTVPVNVPCIACVKNCSNAIGQSGLITFSGFVTNCGNSQLVNVTASNLVGGVLVPITLASNTLNPGAFMPFSGSYANPNICAPVTDTIFVRGTDPLATTNATVTSQCTATCSNILTTCLAVTKNCDTVAIGLGNLVSGLVTNCGNVTITNITVTDNLYGLLTTIPLLAPNTSSTYSRLVTNSTCGNFTNTVTASGQNICGAPVSANASSVCTVTEAPCIQVTKNCDSVVAGQGNLVSGVVTNCGNITLTNISIVDNLYGPLATFATLAPNASQSYSRLVTNATCGNFTNIVTASANSTCGTRVTASATNVCIVTDNPCIRVTKNCDSVVVGQGNLVSGVVTNCGNVTVTNITIVDNLYGSLATFATLAPNASQSYSRLVTNSTCGNFTNIVMATGRSICGTLVTANATNVCVVTENACIAVTKNCDSVAIGLGNLVSGVVTNCGNVTLTNITIVDNLYGSLATFTTLAVGQSLPYSRLVTNATCGNFTNVVMASANSPCGTRVSATATNVCIVTENACIGVTKNCDTVAAGLGNTVSGVVTNCGTVTLTNITVVDNLYGTLATITSLAAGQSQSYNRLVTNNTCGNFTNFVTASGTSPCGTRVTATATNVCIVTENPCIRVTKNCDSVVAGQGNLVSGVVTNCGNITLTNITIVDSLYGQLATFASLAPNASQNYSRLVTNSTCGNFTNVVTASGRSTCGTPVTALATNVCIVTETPCIGVTRNCPPSTNGLPQTISGIVTNCGNVTLTNIVVSDSVLGTITNVGTLAPNATFAYSRTFTAVCPGNTNVTTASANSICGTRVTANATAPCIASCPLPCILVTKEIACAPAGDCTPGLSYSELATGVTSGTNQTAFCYRIGITNCGNDRLTNVIVVDPDLGGVLVGFPTTLDVGQRTNLFFKRSWGVGSHTNTVVASGNGSSTGQSVRDTNTAVAIVRPISVECTITLSSPSDTDGNPNDNHVTLPNSGPVNFMVQVCNTGQATLSVALTGLPCAIPSVTLAAGQCTNVSCMVTVACPGTNYTLTVVGTAVATTDVPCVLDANGRAITTQPSTCRAVVECQLTFCTFTQGFYGNDKRAPLINTLLGPPFGNLVLGKPGRSLTIVQGDGLCVTTRMPSGGPAATLASGNNSFGAGCADGQDIKNGRWGNVLIGQTLALMLNVRFDTNGLGNLALSANFCTAVNPNILTALANLGLPQTVNGLIELANRGLGGQPTGGASLTDLVGATASINEGFDECKTCRPGASSVPSGDVSVPGESSAPNGSGDSDTVGNSSNVKPPVVKRHNNQLELSWSDSGLTLQSAPSPTGPFTDVPDAKTGYTNSFSGKQQFFRLKRD